MKIDLIPGQDVRGKDLMTIVPQNDNTNKKIIKEKEILLAPISLKVVDKEITSDEYNIYTVEIYAGKLHSPGVGVKTPAKNGGRRRKIG